MKREKPTKSLLITKISNLLDGADLSKLQTALKILCTHQHIKEEMPDEDGEYGSAECMDCYTTLGWYCPKSEDRQCYYESQGEKGNPRRFVILTTGKRVYLSDDHNSEYETDDTCVFCGEPDERK